MSGSDLTWILPHWVGCLHWEVRCSILCGCDWMGELHEWKLFVLSCRQEMRSSYWMENPLSRPPLIYPPTKVGASLNESHQCAFHTEIFSRGNLNDDSPMSASPNGQNKQSSMYYLKHGAAGEKNLKVVNCQSLPMILSLLPISVRITLNLISWLATYLTVTKSNMSGP